LTIEEGENVKEIQLNDMQEARRIYDNLPEKYQQIALSGIEMICNICINTIITTQIIANSEQNKEKE